MLVLTHNDDKKQKCYSHLVSIADREDDRLYDFNLSNVIGQGSSYEKALEDFIQKLDKELQRLKSFETMLFCTDALVPIEVDALGKMIKKEEP